MFGDENNQQQDSTGMMQAAMPDPISDGNQASAPSPSFSVPGPTPAPSPAAPASGAPEISDTSEPDSTSQGVNMSSDALMDLKQQALQHLSPLVSHLDQTPEEKFRTTMMMIQASDDQTLIKSAFEAAQQITDDKARAQALLDVINEINYFTQHKS